MGDVNTAAFGALLLVAVGLVLLDVGRNRSAGLRPQEPQLVLPAVGLVVVAAALSLSTWCALLAVPLLGQVARYVHATRVPQRIVLPSQRETPATPEPASNMRVI